MLASFAVVAVVAFFAGRASVAEPPVQPARAETQRPDAPSRSMRTLPEVEAPQPVKAPPGRRPAAGKSSANFTPEDAIVSPVRIDSASNEIAVELVIDGDDGPEGPVRRAVTSVVDAASRTFRDTFGVSLKVVEVLPMRLGEDPRTIDEMYEKVTVRHTPVTGRLTMAFGPRPRAARTSDRPPEWGAAYYFESIVLVCLAPGDRDWPCAGEMLLHELGHTFGAWHSTRQDSVMREFCAQPPVAAFDPVSIEAIRLCLDATKSSTRMASAETLSRLQDLFRDDHVAGDSCPQISTWRRLAYKAQLAGRVNDARRLMQRAMELAAVPGMSTAEERAALESGR